jgi:hypothetical protein
VGVGVRLALCRNRFSRTGNLTRLLSLTPAAMRDGPAPGDNFGVAVTLLHVDVGWMTKAIAEVY